jgi:phenylalanyl-tRNA synthetase alpha subunit
MSTYILCMEGLLAISFLPFLLAHVHMCVEDLARNLGTLRKCPPCPSSRLVLCTGIKKLRFKPAYNPYTEPSMEIFSYHEGALTRATRRVYLLTVPK